MSINSSLFYIVISDEKLYYLYFIVSSIARSRTQPTLYDLNACLTLAALSPLPLTPARTGTVECNPHANEAVCLHFDFLNGNTQDGPIYYPPFEQVRILLYTTILP